MNEYKYRIRFCDNEFGDWVFNLITTEPASKEDIESLIDYWAEVCDRNIENYCPVDIMDHLVDENFASNHPGWRWEDGDEELLIVDW